MIIVENSITKFNKIQKTRKNYLITHNQQVNPINEIVFTHKYQEN